MEIDKIINERKEFYNHLMIFIETYDNVKDEFQNIIKVLEKQRILEDKIQTLEMHQLLYTIGDNHYRTPNFFDKLEKIIEYLIQNQKSSITDTEIYKIYKNNKMFLYFLIEKGFFQTYKIFKNICSNHEYAVYLYPIMEQYLNYQYRHMIFKIYEKVDSKSSKNGENNSYICSLIRQDSVDDFITYVTRTNYPLSNSIQSIFETNSLLLKKPPTLIEYAAFFGSVQIIRYLVYNDIQLDSSIWIYAIHSKNAELIHFLEEKQVEPENYKIILKEAIKCHHNDIANYIIDNYFKKDMNHLINSFSSIITSSQNYYFYPDNARDIIFKSRNKNSFNISQISQSFTTITIPSFMTKIGNNVFRGCSFLTNIVIPSSITSIGNGAFFKCSSLKQITIQSSILSIESYTFYKCSSLTDIIIPPSVTKIGTNAFGGCTSLTQISIPSSVTSIGNSIFSRCTSLKQIIIPSSLTSIADFAFFNCSSLTQISIPSSVTKIGDYAFNECCSLKQISIPSSVTEIGSYAFNGCCSLKQISIPSSVTEIGDYAFNGCSLITQMKIPSSVISIGSNTFEGCTSLTQISFPSSVTSIGFYAFKGCCSLKQIIIPSSVTKIGYYIFSGCSSLTQISIPSSCKDILYNFEIPIQISNIKINFL